MMKSTYQFTHLAHYLSSLSGLGYFVVMTWLMVETPYGMRPHPQQGYWQGFHLLVVPFLVFALGLLWKDHILKKIQNGEPNKRFSGQVLIILFIVMTLSGYLIQVAGTSALIRLIKDIHLYSSFAWIGFYTYHHLGTKILKPKA